MQDNSFYLCFSMLTLQSTANNSFQRKEGKNQPRCTLTTPSPPPCCRSPGPVPAESPRGRVAQRDLRRIVQAEENPPDREKHPSGTRVVLDLQIHGESGPRSGGPGRQTSRAAEWPRPRRRCSEVTPGAWADHGGPECCTPQKMR